MLTEGNEPPDEPGRLERYLIQSGLAACIAAMVVAVMASFVVALDLVPSWFAATHSSVINKTGVHHVYRSH